MTMINWGDAAVQASMISSAGQIVATAIGAICASIIGRQFMDRRRLKARLLLALSDLTFMQEVEKLHCEEFTEQTPDAKILAHKLKIRRRVEERGLRLSGRYTPSRIKAMFPNEIHLVPLNDGTGDGAK